MVPAQPERAARGSVLVEAAIASVLLVVLIAALVDFGRIGYSRSRLKYAVSQAARFATTGARLEDPAHPGQALSRGDSIVALIHSLSGLSDPNRLSVTITATTPDGRTVAGAGGPGDVVTVRARYRVPLVAPFLAALFPDGELEITAATTFRNEEFQTSAATVGRAPAGATVESGRLG
ncbi:MAG: pilus assembly protein [Candidatus Dadabacteria bacterium]|nr:MAG: pilus assembly protein [Candidatus Dadabacteria bacterium]